MDPTYASTGALHLRSLIPLELLAWCHERLRDAQWAPDTVTGSAFAFDTTSMSLPRLMDFLDGPANLRPLLGLKPTARFSGRLKRLGVGPDYRFPWHRDHRHGRLVGMSVNLSEGPVEGGVFEQRLRWEKEPTVCIHSAPGDIHLFDVSDPRWVHRVTPLVSGERVVLAGWWR